MMLLQSRASGLQVTVLAGTKLVLLQVHCSLTKRMPTKSASLVVTAARMASMETVSQQHANTPLTLPRTASERHKLAQCKMLQQR